MEGALKLFESEIVKLKNQLKQLKEANEQKPSDLLKMYLNKEIHIEFLTNEKMNGKLIQFDRYNIILETDDKNILIPKHTIKFITEK